MAPLSKILIANGQDPNPVPGYNYALYSLHTRRANEVATVLRANKQRIEDEYQARTGTPLRLLPFVALVRPRSILVPLPFDSSINVISDVLATLELYGVALPFWS